MLGKDGPLYNHPLTFEPFPISWQLNAIIAWIVATDGDSRSKSISFLACSAKKLTSDLGKVMRPG